MTARAHEPGRSSVPVVLLLFFPHPGGMAMTMAVSCGTPSDSQHCMSNEEKSRRHFEEKKSPTRLKDDGPRMAGAPGKHKYRIR